MGGVGRQCSFRVWGELGCCRIRSENSVSDITITAGPYQFRARWEDAASPQTCAMFRKLLPYSEKIIHVRWSGEACWIPLGDFDTGLPYENATSYPAPGQILLHAGSVSETEILLSYGACCFASKAGQLAGNHFLSITEGVQDLVTLGKKTLWEGAQEIVFGA